MSELKVEIVEKVLRKFDDDLGQYNRDINSFKLGRILTVVDSSIADETQRKAMKDLIHDAWYSSSNHRTYPQMRHVAEALGLKLYEDMNVALPVQENDYNPYKELVK